MSLLAHETDALMTITSRPDIVFTKGQGSWLWDRRGRKYLDLIQGWAVNCLGHCHPSMVQALQKQSLSLINPSPAFYNEPAMGLANRLIQASCFDRVFFTNSGAEANEGNIKLARKWGQKHRHGAYKIITFENGFHGRTLATMSASGKPGWDQKFPPQVDGFPKAVLNDIDSVKKLIDADTVAVMLEPVQGEAGVIPATREFMQDLRALTKEKGILLIVDEVQTGMGRCGSLFAYQLFDIEPDLMSLGKGIGGGVPLAAQLAKEFVCSFEPGDQGGTYNGNPLCTEVGCAVFDVLTEPGFLEQVNERAEQLSQGLQNISQKWNMLGERGMGLLRALLLDKEDGHAIVDAAREYPEFGLLLNAPRPNLLRFMPALNLSEATLQLALDTLDKVIAEVRK
ncbi:acetylornithine transaminase [Basilea psittacipulmonis]|uniref:Acetylornithine aminotransferase n=1 Tax=Basilea psittacipulmonis DSM 24701 TaxID=1072685 RepID=A0A077DCX3_9BURK|nr:acetylornithine transaminase [Basilea psittacipulmonis]AIL32021.1 acetylornithine aminotransferase [Basilea psittacipulmonis DSM 24701]